MKLNRNKIWQSIQNGEKLPRKAKKAFLGKRMKQSSLRRLLKSVNVMQPAQTMYESPVIFPYLFCPKCGCTESTGTGNMTSYPEHWEYFYCIRCHEKVAYIDNSPFIHALEFPELNFKID